MAKNQFVVVIEGTDMYLTGYNIGMPSHSVFGNVENAITYPTLDAANEVAQSIGAGTVGTTKP